jgi:ParB/RepB/Spo0J family partition protein
MVRAAKKVNLAGTTKSEKDMVLVDLHDLTGNIGQGRAPVPTLQQMGFGIFEPMEGSDEPALLSLALATEDVKNEAGEVTSSVAEQMSQFVSLIDDYEPDIAKLASDIQVQGQLENARVRGIDGSKFDLIFGCRRALAIAYNHAKSAGKLPARLECEVVNTDDKASIFAALSENALRKNPSPMDEARFYHRLKKNFSMKPKEIAELVGLDHQVVRQRLQLNDLTPEQQNRVHKGTLGVVKALKILKGDEAPDATKNDARVRMPNKKEVEHLYGALEKTDLDAEWQPMWETITEEVRKFLASCLKVEYLSRRDQKQKNKYEEELRAAAAAQEAEEAAKEEAATAETATAAAK